MQQPIDLSACDGDRYRALVGRPEASLRDLLILRPVRVIRPETRVTWPPLAERLNFEIGPDGRVARVFCG